MSPVTPDWQGKSGLSLIMRTHNIQSVRFHVLSEITECVYWYCDVDEAAE